MKKLLPVLLLLLTVLSGCSADFKSKLQSRAEGTTSTKTPQHSRLKNKMVVIGTSYKNNASVAYLLLEDGTVLIFRRTGTDAPLTKDAARAILQNSEQPVYHNAVMIDCPAEKDIARILLANGDSYKSEATVAYLLHTNGEVEICRVSGTEPPFTREEAKMIMSDIGTEIYY